MPMKPAAPDSTAPIGEADRDQPAEQEADNDEDHHADDADGGVLALEIGLRALAHGGRQSPASSGCRHRPPCTDLIAQTP